MDLLLGTYLLITEVETTMLILETGDCQFESQCNIGLAPRFGNTELSMSE